jgi:hypothetical protein
MELKNLVPPLDLCKLIPEGEFADSAFVWLNIQYTRIPWKVVERRISRYKMERNKKSFPAPTTDEILDKCKDIPGVLNPSLWWQGIWKTDCAIDKSGKLSEEFFEDADLENLDLVCAEDKSAATAALKLWLNLKGIEA